MTEPFLNLLHRHTVRQKQRGAAMTKVVKSDLTHPAGFEQLREALRYIVRLDQIADFIDAYSKPFTSY